VDHLLTRDREQRGLPVAHALDLVHVDPGPRALAHRVPGEQVLHEQRVLELGGDRERKQQFLARVDAPVRLDREVAQAHPDHCTTVVAAMRAYRWARPVISRCST
jgi:hypothetical protein